MRNIVLVSLLALTACGTTPAQQQAIISAGVTLAQVAAKQSTTVAAVVQEGALICGEASSVSGQLVEGTAEAILTSDGIPASVLNQVSSDVAAACPNGTVPGPAPANAASIPVAAAAAPLPAVATTSGS